uniref:Uncharacterized protein n=1 Tax=Pelusios castaneus TaxID=367368 RepID=A0A8C8RH33_9SAUR
MVEQQQWRGKKRRRKQILCLYCKVRMQGRNSPESALLLEAKGTVSPTPTPSYGDGEPVFTTTTFLPNPSRAQERKSISWTMSFITKLN